MCTVYARRFSKNVRFIGFPLSIKDAEEGSRRAVNRSCVAMPVRFRKLLFVMLKLKHRKIVFLCAHHTQLAPGEADRGADKQAADDDARQT